MQELGGDMLLISVRFLSVPPPDCPRFVSDTLRRAACQVRRAAQDTSAVRHQARRDAPSRLPGRQRHTRPRPPVCHPGVGRGGNCRCRRRCRRELSLDRHPESCTEGVR